MNKSHIQNKVDRTLDSLDGLQRAEANPYLFTRIKARLGRQRNVWSRGLDFISRPAVAFLIIIAVCINALIFLGAGPDSMQQPNPAGEQQFSTEYSLTDNSAYDSPE